LTNLTGWIKPDRLNKSRPVKIRRPNCNLSNLFGQDFSHIKSIYITNPSCHKLIYELYTKSVDNFVDNVKQYYLTIYQITSF